MGISRRAGNFILGVIHILLQTAWRQSNGSLSASHESVIGQIPTTIETALLRFGLDDRTTIYAVCPSCHCTYKPKFLHGSVIPRYPKLCTNKARPDSAICNTNLLQESDVASKPIKTYVYHHFFDYLSGLLSRKDLEEQMDKVCDDFKHSLGQPPPEYVTNIFEADFLRSFKGPEPGTLFVDRGNEGRFLFVMHVDFFANEGMSIRGASTSCGIISCACLNLPLEIRYKPENMYIAGIFGPREPHLEQLNHYMRPLIDDMVIGWNRGVQFSRTALHSHGRLARTAIAISCNDLPAARKVSQLGAVTSHNYCTVCQCHHKSTLGRVDFEHADWNPPDNDKLRKLAEAWKDALSNADQDSITSQYGIRWSEFWRLPYWNPSRQLVVDAMHCILEGLSQLHAREALQLTKAAAAATPDIVPAFDHPFTKAREGQGLSTKIVKHVNQIHDLLVAPAADDSTYLVHLQDKLLKKNLPALKFVGEDLGVDGKGQSGKSRKVDWAKALVDWVGMVITVRKFTYTSIYLSARIKTQNIDYTSSCESHHARCHGANP
jgi:hypothetical protein